MPLPPYSDTLQYLYRADAGTFGDLAGTTPATADGATVALWRDQSASANDLGSTAAPTLKLAQVNGLPCLRFDGAANYMRFSNTYVSPARTIYAVIRSSSAGVITLTAGDHVSLEYRLDALKPRLVNALTADIGFATSAIASNTWTQLNASWDGAAGVFRQAGAANGTVAGSGGLGVNRYVGALEADQDWFSGDIALLMEYVGVQDTTHRQAVEAWITGIWGV